LKSFTPQFNESQFFSNVLLGAVASQFLLEFVEKPAAVRLGDEGQAENARKKFRIYWNK